MTTTREPATTDTVERSTRLGRVRGIERLGVETYLGIRYAGPVPRFQPATLSTAQWNGTYDATVHQPMALQPAAPRALEATFGSLPGMRFAEDCHFLNIHVPEARAASSRPVIVYIHGGAFAVGGGSFYDGTALALGTDAVVVCINYRLGVFAAFDLTWLGTERDGGGQHWLGDQITALQWVRDNIADYGGDPNLVTIIGGSAGAVSVTALCAAPLAEGLVHRAVACSTAHLVADPSTDVVAAIAKARRSTRAEAVEYLRTAPAEALIAAQARRRLAPIPVANTPLLPGSAEELIRARGAKAVPLIAGYATHEGVALDRMMKLAVPIPPPLSNILCHLGAVGIARHAAKGQANVTGYLRRLRRATGSVGFGGRYNDLIWTDGFRRGAMDYCEATTSAGSRAYLYVWAVPMRFGGKSIPPSHGGDIPFTFNIWDDPRHSVPDFADHPNAPALGRRWVELLGHFARYGEPGPALGDWPIYDAERRHSLRIGGDECRLEQNVDASFREKVWRLDA